MTSGGAKAVASKVTRLAVGLVALVALAFYSCGPDYAMTRASQEAAFATELGVAASASISEIRVRTVRVGDSWQRWMRFTIVPEVFAKITNGGWFVSAQRNDFDNWASTWSQALVNRSPNAPRWWATPTDFHTVVYFRTNHPRDIAGYQLLWLDSTNGWAFALSAAWH